MMAVKRSSQKGRGAVWGQLYRTLEILTKTGLESAGKHLEGFIQRNYMI